MAQGLYIVKPVTAATSTPDAGSAFAQEILLPIVGLGTGAGVAADQSENVFVCDSANHVIYRYRRGQGAPATANNLQPSITSTTRTVFAGTYGVAGNLDKSGTGTPASAKFNTPTFCCVNRSGFLYVIDSGNSLIRKVDQNGNVFTVAQLSASDTAVGIAVDASDNVYVLRGGPVATLPTLPTDISNNGSSNAPSEYGM
jgi:sugar lactone lactonase YvrE